MSNENTKKFKNKFWVGFFIVLALILGAVAWGLTYLWNLMAEYEVSTPKYALSNVASLFVADNYATLTQNNKIDKSAYESDENVVTVFSEQLADGEITYSRLVKESSDTEQSYVVKAGATVVGEVTIGFEDTANFGRWNITDTKLSIPTWGDVIVRIPQSAKLLVNGQEVSQEYIVKTDIAYERLKYIPDTYVIPKEVEYRINGFVDEPTIEVLDINSNPLAVTLSTEPVWDLETEEELSAVKPYYASVALNEPVEDIEAIKDMAISDSQKYSYYLSRDASFTGIANRMVRESKIYDDIRRMDVIWYANHNSVSFTEENPHNIISYSPDIFTVDMDYLYTVFRSGNQVHPFETKIRLVYVRDANDW